MSLGTDTVVTRETAWLTTTGDGLPTLVKANFDDASAPFDLVQAYYPRQPGDLRAVYVMRAAPLVLPEGSGRMTSRHQMRTRLWWPLLDPDAQADQTAFDQALDKLLERIIGPVHSKTHGGRFLSAAEGPEGVRATPVDVPRALEQGKALAVDVLYTIDDVELNL